MDRTVEIQRRLTQVEDRIFLTEALPDKIGIAVAKHMKGIEINTTQAVWWQIIEIDLSSARTAELYGTYPEEPDCIVYLPDSTGTGTLHLDSSGSHGLAFGTTYKKFRGKFRDLYVTNAAQSGCYMYLLLAKGDVSIEDYTTSPMDLQAQYRPVIASTTAVLGANETYTSDWYNIANFARGTLLSAANVASAARGVQIQQSTDGVNVDYTTPFTTRAITIGLTTIYVAHYSAELLSDYARIVYLNGAVAQTSFRLEARARVI